MGGQTCEAAMEVKGQVNIVKSKYQIHNTQNTETLDWLIKRHTWDIEMGTKLHVNIIKSDWITDRGQACNEKWYKFI